ncbi:hypothetical protein BGZ51_009427 [Haplosporangium sp. Z 767]|nr:hypothetical protein BGZ51_009427 [Haplosporangium sp. Z 767]
MLGKTVYLEALVKANKESRFVVVTTRRTVADMLEVRLGSENYQDILPDLIARDSVVVQAEPLCRLDMTFYSENTILILDEISSLIKQIDSSKEQPDLSNEEVDILKSMRSDFHVISNTFQQQKDNKVTIFESKWKLIVEAQDLLRACKRLWISSTMSAKCTEILDAMLTKAGFKGRYVTKNTSESEKRDIGMNINTIMADLDYFIHTPAICVGVDYNVKDHVDYAVGIFALEHGGELSAAQRASVHKHPLMRAYDVKSHDIVTTEWIKTYDNKREKEIFRNLVALSPSAGSSLQECLRGVRQREDLSLEYNVRGATSAEAHTKVEKSQYVKLECVIGIMAACGYEDTFTTNEVLAENLKERIDGIWPILKGKVSDICISIKERRPTSNDWTFKNKLAFINMYCMKYLVPRLEPPDPTNAGRDIFSSTIRA